MNKKFRIGIFIVCMMAFSILTTSAVFAVRFQPNYAASFLAESEQLDVNSLQDLSKSLEMLGLVICTNGKPNLIHLSRLSPDEPVAIASMADVDVLLSLALLISNQQYGRLGFSWDTCVDTALTEAGLYEYWMYGWRQIMQPTRNQQIADLATRYSFDELNERIFSQRPCMLLEFQALGFFSDIAQDTNTQRRGW